MIVIRSRLSLFLCFAVLSTAIIPVQGIFAAEKVLSMMPNNDTLDGWKLRGPKFISKWVVGVAKIDPKNPKKLTVVTAEFVKVELNGEVIQENVKIEKGPTSGALKNGEFAEGPLMLQGGMGAVAYRNIRISVPGQ